MKALAISMVAGAALCSVMVVPASAMPMTNLAAAANDLSLGQSVRWVCGRYGCRWRPNYYSRYSYRSYYGYRPSYYGYGPSYGYGLSYYGSSPSYYGYGPRYYGFGLGYGYGPSSPLYP